MIQFKHGFWPSHFLKMSSYFAKHIGLMTLLLGLLINNHVNKHSLHILVSLHSTEPILEFPGQSVSKKGYVWVLPWKITLAKLDWSQHADVIKYGSSAQASLPRQPEWQVQACQMPPPQSHSIHALSQRRNISFILEMPEIGHRFF